MERIFTCKLGVVVERRQGVTRWAQHVWRPVSVFLGDAPQEGWQEMPDGEERVHFCTGGAELMLHHTEAEEYVRNLSSPNPSLCVVLAPAPGDIPWKVHLVTASASEGDVYTLGGENIVEAVPIPDELRPIMTEFAKAHYRPEDFKKRKRDTPAALVEHKFGKEPIFARRRGEPSKGSSHD